MGIVRPPAPESVVSRGVMTLAVGSDEFRTMAQHLGLSLAHNSPTLPRTVVSDRRTHALEHAFDDVIVIPEGALPASFEAKLELDRLAPYDETLFIDCDSLVVRDLRFAWDHFDGRTLGIAARPVPAIHFPMASLPARFRDVKQLPAFNGGTYFLRRGTELTSIFDEARMIAAHYDDWQLRRVRGARAEEPAIGLALARRQDLGVDDTDNPLMRSLINVGPCVAMDVLSGMCRFSKGGEMVSPAIVHFAGTAAKRSFLYRREMRKLDLLSAGVWRQPSPRPRSLRYPLVGPELWLREWWARVQAR